MAKRQTIRKVGLLVGSLGSVWLLAPLRVANPTVNQLVAFLTVWLVFISFGLACLCLQSRLWIRIATSIPFFLVALLFPLALMVSMVAGGPSAAYDVIDSVDLSHSRVVAYRISGGATTGDAISVVQAMSILPGIVFTKNLVTGHQGTTAAMRKVNGNSIVVVMDGRTTEYAVHGYVYF